MRQLIHAFIFALSIFKLNESASILVVIPSPSISHQVVFRPLTQELAKRGHEVVVITTDPAFPKGKTPANLTEVDLHDLSYEVWLKYISSTVTGKSADLMTQMKVIFELLTVLFDHQLQTEEFQQVLQRKTKFDLLMLEACFRPTLGLSHIFKAPVIQVSSFGAYGNYEIIGAPTHPFLYPGMIRQRVYNLTMMEKVKELYNYFSIANMFEEREKTENEVLRKHFGNDIPPLSELANNVHMLFLNVHPIFEGNRPVPPSVIHLWGIHQKPEKELPQDLKSYLDSSKHGVIFMSFGTNTIPSLLPPEKIKMFVEVFSQLPYDVMWKWDKDVLPGRPKNVRIGKWFPQSDLLRHPKLKLFITQGGLQSTDEAITAGVPMVGIPMLGDQWYNVEKYVFHKIGLKLDMETLTYEDLKSAIETVINDESYRRNIVKLRNLFNDQPQTALDRAVWWTEYVLRHGGARHLRSPSANISWAEYLELELVFVLLLSLLAMIAVFVIVVYYLYKFVRSFFVSNVKYKTK